MKATIAQTRNENGRNMDGDKERIHTLTLVGVMNDAPAQLAQARFWMSRSADGAGPVYCSVWVRSHWGTAGRGVARGGGYHKASAALGNALASAGVTLDTDINGVGEGAMRDALIAVGVAMGHDALTLMVMS